MATSDKVDREAGEKFFTWEGPMQLLRAAILKLLERRATERSEGGSNATSPGRDLEAAGEKFFTWESRTQLLLAGGLVSLVGGLASLLVGLVGFGSGYVPIGLIALGFSIYLIGKGVKNEKFPTKYYDAVQKAKECDFYNVLIRSFKQTEMDIDSLLDFDATDLVSVDPTTVSSADRDLIKKLDSKAYFLYGSKEEPDRLQRISVDGQDVLEYSPIFVSILYLTRSELIIYFANIDITRGDLQIEEMNRAFLKDVVKVTVTSKFNRKRRVNNENLFKQFEKATQSSLGNEIIYPEHVIRLSMTDGQYLSLPVGEPEYRSGEQGILDLDPTEEEEGKFTRFAREIFKRINDAKRTLHDNDAF